MKNTANSLVPVILMTVVLGACQSSSEAPTDMSDAAGAATGKPVPVPRSPDKLSAPITFDYSITGNPMVGQAVSVNVDVSSPLKDRPITLHYRMNEFGSMTFPESQAESAVLAPLANSELRSRQITLVPQREGRVYVVVSAEIETDIGPMMKSMSIPIQVGRAAGQPNVNGELVEGTDGETGISMPSKEPR